MRCDGLVVCTPAGSTGYNLANGGPVMAWGVEGFGVSFIAPHSLDGAGAGGRARRRRCAILNRSRARPSTSRSTGGRRARWSPGASCRRASCSDAALLAQLPGASFYRRLREKFGRLSLVAS